MLSWRNLRGQAIAVIERLASTATPPTCPYLPLCHVAEQMLTTVAPLHLGSRIDFGESLRTVQEDLREVAPSMFLGVPRIWEKLASSIHIKLMEAGGVRRWLFDRCYAACEPFAEVPRQSRSLGQKATAAFAHLLIFRALLNFIGLRKAKIAMNRRGADQPEDRPLLPHSRCAPGRGLRRHRDFGVGHRQKLDHLVPGSVGSAAAGVELKRGAFDELLVRGDVVFAGYYKNEAATAAAIVDGWLHTGDVVVETDGEFPHRRPSQRHHDHRRRQEPLAVRDREHGQGEPLLKECIVIGEARKYVSALIQIDFETVSTWAEDQGIGFNPFPLAGREPEGSRTDRARGGDRQRRPRPGRAHPQVPSPHQELDHDDDEVTATMKVRRSNIQTKYARRDRRALRLGVIGGRSRARAGVPRCPAIVASAAP